jgi:hypothetical protein
LGEGVGGPKDELMSFLDSLKDNPDPLGMFSTTSDPIFNRNQKYDKNPTNPFK